jgi:hypothetical protein
MIRVYICPVIGSGVKGDSYRSKAATFGYEYANFIPSNLDGTPKFSWALAVVRSADFTAIEADATCDDLFGGDLPANVDTRPELRALLKNRTVADVPLARRNAIIAVLDKYAVDRTDFTGQTPLWRVFQRVVSTLFSTTANEIDPEFPGF